MRKSIYGVVLCLLAVNLNAALLTFTNESDYLSAISSSTTIFEGFDDGPFTAMPYGGAENVTHQGFIWFSSDYLKTGNNWGRNFQGVWDSPGDPDMINIISTIGEIYGVGGWIRGYTPMDLTFSLDGVDVLSVDLSVQHQFFGVIDTNGFTSVSLSTSTTPNGDWGADDFTFATSPVSAVPIPSAVWLLGSGLISLIGFARRKT